VWKTKTLAALLGSDSPDCLDGGLDGFIEIRHLFEQRLHSRIYFDCCSSDFL
jgi:hypothetical protein